MLEYDWSTAGVLNPIGILVNSHRILVIYCSEHEAIVLALHCQ